MTGLMGCAPGSAVAAVISFFGTAAIERQIAGCSFLTSLNTKGVNSAKISLALGSFVVSKTDDECFDKQGRTA